MNDLQPLLLEIFENAPDCLLVTEVTPDGRFRHYRTNRAWERATGLVGDQVAGRYLDEVIPAASADTVLARYRQCVRQGTPLEYEEEWATPAGPSWAWVTLTPIRHAAGHVYRLFSVARDITERMQAQMALAESERRYREIFDNASDSLYLLQVGDDGGLRYIDVNPAFERVAGAPRAKLVGRDAAAGLAGAQAGAIVAMHRRCVDSAAVVDSQLDCDLPDGRRTFHCTLAPLLDAAGRVRRVVGISRDITARTHSRQLEAQRLRVYEMLAQGAKLADILDAVLRCIETIRPDFLASVMLLDDSGEHLSVSSAPRLPADYLAAIDGIRAGEGVGSCGTAVARCERVISENLDSDPNWRDYRALARAAGLAACWSEPIFDSAGKVLGTFGIYRRQPGRPNEVELELVRQAGYLLATVVERTQADSLQRAREQEFRMLVENSPDAVARYDSDGRRSYVNPVLARRAGLPAPQMLGLRPGHALDMAPALARRYEESVHSVLGSGREAECQLSWRSANGQIVHSQVRMVPELASDGTVTGVLAIGRDITALMAAQRQLSTLVESLPDLIVHTDRAGRILYANAGLAGMLLRPGDDFVGRTLEECGLDAHGLIRAARERAVAEARPNVAEMPASYDERQFEVRHVPELDEHGRVVSVLAIGRDISERKRAEQLLQDQHFRREAAREEERKHIARELHDELGQFLSALRLEVSMLRQRHGPNNPALREKTDDMVALVDRIIRGLRDLVASLRPAVLDLGIATALEWLVGEFTARAGLACTLHIDEDRVRLDPEQTTMVFRLAQESLTNVVRHAQATQVTVVLERRGDEYRLSLRDNGRGFDPAAVRDPKSFGLLGLRERAQMLGGRLDIRSSPGAGTTVAVSFPGAPKS